MPGAFDISSEFDDDPLLTAEEIERCGAATLLWLEAVASGDQRPVDQYLVNEIHRRWFATTFPFDAGVHRKVIVANRKGTAAPVSSILPSLDAACGNWAWRMENLWPSDELEQIEFAVAEANTLAVAVYDIHPFIDGNTRATWHLRNYLLMLAGLPPLIELVDQTLYEEAWWSATPTDHDQLDRCVLEELRMQEER